MHNMHNGMITSTGADQDDQLVHDPSYSAAPWVAMNSYGQMPMASYPGEEYYSMHHMPPHGLPSESLGGHMGASPFAQNMHPNSFGNQLPPPSIIPTQGQVPWPSLQTNPSQSYHHAPVTIPHPPPPARQQPKLPTLNTSQPRRTLTDEDRREMCKYADENPGVKQHDIGVKFGVERSTVSKVLRKKEVYLNQDDRSGSPIRKNKGKSPPDIERALAQWVKNMYKKGLVVSDFEMEERAKIFCAGSDSSLPLKTITATWIEKFKQKHGVGHGRLIRRASETAIPDSTRLDRLDTESPIVSTSQTPNGISPASPAAKDSPLLSSASTKAEDKEGHSRFSFAHSGYKHPNSQSTTSLNSAITDPPSSTFSQGAFSPGSQFTFSPDPNTGMFGEPVSNSAGFHRPRSHTVPNVPAIEYVDPSQTTEPQTPKYGAADTGPSSAIESPAHELPGQSFNLDAAISPRNLHRVGSNGSLAGRSTTSGAGLGSTPTSPTQEDARRAVDTLLNYTQGASGVYLDRNDFLVFLNIIEKWGLGGPQLSGSKTGSGIHGLGGLSRIPEGDTEMANSGSPNYKSEAPI